MHHGSLFLFSFFILLFISFVIGSNTIVSNDFSKESYSNVSHFVVNLDLDPQDRWTHIVSDPFLKQEIFKTVATLEQWIPGPLLNIFLEIVSIVGSDIDTHL